MKYMDTFQMLIFCWFIFSPMEIQMRKHEVQARIRDLKNKNSTLLSLISQLGMEWKEVYLSTLFLGRIHTKSVSFRLQKPQ